jgi:hypothetical protein
MKKISILLAALLVCATNSYAQLKITKIKSKEKDHYLATVIGYPVTGIYTYPNQAEPTTTLNPDGSGIMQNEDLDKENIIWGIECTASGIPLFKEGFNSASYTFWYKKNNDEDWIAKQLSIHFDKQKMFIAGERMKEYVE